jgi:hypothetical protein
MFQQFATVEALLNSSQVTQINHGHDVLITADSNNTITLSDVSLNILKAHPGDFFWI